MSCHLLSAGYIFDCAMTFCKESIRQLTFTVVTSALRHPLLFIPHINPLKFASPVCLSMYKCFRLKIPRYFFDVGIPCIPRSRSSSCRTRHLVCDVDGRDHIVDRLQQLNIRFGFAALNCRRPGRVGVWLSTGEPCWSMTGPDPLVRPAGR